MLQIQSTDGKVRRRYEQHKLVFTSGYSQTFLVCHVGPIPTRASLVLHSVSLSLAFVCLVSSPSLLRSLPLLYEYFNLKAKDIPEAYSVLRC
jgi:hypothetical protein